MSVPTRHGRGTTDERNRALKPRRLLHVPNIQLKCTHRKYSVSEALPNKHWLARSVGRSEHKKSMILQSHRFRRNKQANNIDNDEKICNSLKVAANLGQTLTIMWAQQVSHFETKLKDPFQLMPYFSKQILLPSKYIMRPSECT